ITLMQDETKKTIGRAEKLSFPELELTDIPARIDTGAKTSSLWASDIREENGILTAVLLGQGNSAYTGQIITFTEFDTTVVASSTGHTQERYKVRILVKLKGKKVRAWFTLADRSTQVYPVLIGRNVLLGKFVVDVKKGHVLKEAELKRTEELRAKTEEEK
ncbi:MAG TPA: RimK/LysX family protein, partial [Candidatus Saccharimonadales bacterium]|nr:RimK/LysX family protein [Candidatus Saccharimonadales bacterium]